jgi:hypothetical protein
MDNDGKEVSSLVLEKRQIEEKLHLAGGGDFHFLLEDCSDLADMIDEIEDVSSQMHEKEHAAFDSKVKFSRKVRRKAKDMKNFEQHLVSEYESKHITLEHGKRMVSIIKLLRSKSVEKARREAEEFYKFLEMGSRLEIINDILLKKRAQLERAKRDVAARLSGIEWLEKEPPVDAAKAERHSRSIELEKNLQALWASRVHALQAMPMAGLLKEMNEGELGKTGFPVLPASEADALAAYLHPAGLENKTAEQLHEMAGQSESLLRHLGLDLALFRREVADRRAFLFSVMSFSAHAPGQHEIAYLSAHDGGAQKMADELSELGKTKDEDGREWGRAEKMKKKREELAGVDREMLEKPLQELSALEDVLDGKAAPAGQEGKNSGGLVASILALFGKK